MKNLELYIHIPFCEKKCNYCDFVSFHPNINDVSKYIETLLKEIENKSYLANDYIISSIYIGGGTPSFIDSKNIKFIIESINKYYKISTTCEISIEVNPNSASFEKLKTYFEVGINRISIGLQSCNELELSALGRVHNYNDFLSAYDNIIHIGYKNVNVDLINGIPNQTSESYKKTLKQILSLKVPHISIYNLIVEPNTVFYNLQKQNKLMLPNEDEIIKMDEITKELTKYYGLNRYEISNYAKNGFECRHNLGYWSDIPYLGFGLNSSSYFENKRYKNKTILSEYIKLDYGKYITSADLTNYYQEITDIDKINHINEYVMLGFRKTSGINANDFYKTFKEVFNDLFKNPIAKYLTTGLLINDNGVYYLSDDGLDISNTILSDFMLDTNS